MWFVGAPVTFGEDPVAAIPAEVQMVATGPRDRHLTLAFLGREPREAVVRVWGALPPLALPEHAVAVGWERFGRRALALTLADDDAVLRSLAGTCGDVARAELAGFQRSARFRPHVTVGRLAKTATPPTAMAMRGWPVPQEPLGLGPLTLFRSSAAGAGDRYEVVEQQAPTTPDGPA